MLEWYPPGRRRRRRSRNSWIQEVTIEMREKGINIGIDRQRRMEKENKTLGTERYENIYTMYINKK